MNILRKFPPTFWVANTMEIFERMAWYGFYALSSVYLTDPRSKGGLGLTSEERGILQGIVPFFLYLFPVVTGALADKFGYKRTFLTAFLILTPGYYLLGQPEGFWGFFFVFLLVAIGAATFKPVVVGTVGHVTTSETKALGFGIFYMMVNVGGFAGPLIAGIVRNEMGWRWIFGMSSIWIACNIAILLLFYKEPEGRARGLEEELRAERPAGGSPPVEPGAVAWQVLGAALRILPAFIAAGILLGWKESGLALGGLAAAALLVAGLFAVTPEDVRIRLRKTGRDIVEVLGNPSFFIMAAGTIVAIMLAGGKWISWKDCGLLSAALIGSNLILDSSIRKSAPARARPGLWRPARIGDWRFALYLLLLSGFWTVFNQLFITMPEYIRDYTNTHDILGWMAGACGSLGLESWAQGIRGWMAEGRQINPEWLVNIDAGAIVLFQILISWMSARWKPFTTIVLGTVLSGLGLGLGVFGGTGWMVSLAILVFSVGEMLASPKSQEYVARIAPPAKTAMYMGYFFVSMALGYLFGGILSGQMYGHFGRDAKNPKTMWLIFAGLAVLAAAALWLYDRLVVRRMPASRAGEGSKESG